MGFFDEKVVTLSVPIDGDIDGDDQHLAVELQSDGTISVIDTAGDTPYGVLYSYAEVEGEPATVAVGGVVSMVAGGTVSVGDEVAVDSDGKAVEATTTGHSIIGWARTGGAADEIISVDFRTYIGTVPE